jgi:hypothetical protein
MPVQSNMLIVAERTPGSYIGLTCTNTLNYHPLLLSENHLFAHEDQICLGYVVFFLDGRLVNSVLKFLSSRATCTFL